MSDEEQAFPDGLLNEYGMTLRDYFAAKAMQSLLRQYPDHLMNSPANEVACDAYILADAMLKAREA